MLLDRIRTENDIKKIDPKDYPALAQEIRDFLIEKTSETGGHLGANLGAVELTMALHLMLDLPKDKLIWDVGHQSYTHKILTGRKEGFDRLRKFGGMSGFPKRKESDCDCFDTGHSSTSVSAGLGYAKARDLKGEDYTVVSVIGDGSLTGGMAYEAMNNAAELETNFIIVLNDNNMSISESHGGMNRYLNAIRTSDTYMSIKDSIYYGLLEKPGYGQKVVKGIQNVKNSIKQLVIPGMYFEDMGLKYLGPVDGHDIKTLLRTFQEARTVKGAVIVHVITQKGRGYEPAQNHPARFHGAEPFDIATGLPKKRKEKPNYTDIFSTMMNKMAEADDSIVAITAAMPDGTGLKRFSHRFPERFFDVGIAEEHAVTFAAGLAAGGLHPVVAIYSSFLQRAYDQIIHDVCLQNLPVIFAVDRAGLVGSDGETHQGIFDISFLNTIPNMTILAPKNKWELADMLLFAKDYDAPVAIRYPRGLAYDGLREYREEIVYGKAEILRKGEKIALFALGSMIPSAIAVADRLEKEGVHLSVINARFAKPFDTELLHKISGRHKAVVTLEENVITGGFGESVLSYCAANLPDLKVTCIALEDAYVEHGNTEILKKEHGIDEDSIYRVVKSIVSSLAE